METLLLNKNPKNKENRRKKTNQLKVNSKIWWWQMENKKIMTLKRVMNIKKTKNKKELKLRTARSNK